MRRFVVLPTHTCIQLGQVVLVPSLEQSWKWKTTPGKTIVLYMIARGSVPRTLCKATTRSHNKFRGCVYDVCPTKSPEVRTMISSLCGPESWKPTPCWFPLDSRVLSCARHMSTGPNTLFTTLRLQSLGSKGMPSKTQKSHSDVAGVCGFQPSSNDILK